jgi:recombination protein RecR
MSSYTQSIQNLMNQLARLPGIGMRSAERIAFHLLKQRPEDAMQLAEAIRDVKTRIKNCSTCYNLTEQDPCSICADAARDQGLVCIVEQPKDLLALESAGLYKGVYHVLLGRISPLEGVEPGDLTIEPLMTRLASGAIRELIMGTNPTWKVTAPRCTSRASSAPASPRSKSPASPAASPPAATSSMPTATSSPTP